MPAPARHVLFPGRHHLLTRFQADYLTALGAGTCTDTDGAPIRMHPDWHLVAAVTSANHGQTRRNPVPYHRREAALELFCAAERLRGLVVPVFDTAPTPRFAEITIKNVAADTGVELTPADTVVACSTPAVAAMYRRLGYRIAPVELGHTDDPLRPWDVLELLVTGDPRWERLTHEASRDVYRRYRLVAKIREVCTDPVVGDDGGLTDTRQYRSYIASFDAAAGRKWRQVAAHVQPGRIVDIGCATGALLELAGTDPALHESDLFGVEVSRHLFDECMHKKAQGVFPNPNTFFIRANALTGPVMPERSVDTTLTFALTHEIYSYGGGLDALATFVQRIFAHTAPGGVWVNSDVCGPAGRDRPVRLELAARLAATEPLPVCRDLHQLPAGEVKAHLDRLDAAGRFTQFARDFRAHAGVAFPFTRVPGMPGPTVELTLGDAMEFLTKQAYTDNWLSETHEQFCALTWQDWVRLVTDAGFEVDGRSGPWRNDWVVENVLAPAGRLLDPGTGTELPWPDTHLLLVARRPRNS